MENTGMKGCAKSMREKIEGKGERGENGQA
jgi:hypothetical protein